MFHDCVVPQSQRYILFTDRFQFYTECCVDQNLTDLRAFVCADSNLQKHNAVHEPNMVTSVVRMSGLGSVLFFGFFGYFPVFYGLACWHINEFLILMFFIKLDVSIFMGFFPPFR